MKIHKVLGLEVIIEFCEHSMLNMVNVLTFYSLKIIIPCLFIFLNYSQANSIPSWVIGNWTTNDDERSLSVTLKKDTSFEIRRANAQTPGPAYGIYKIFGSNLTMVVQRGYLAYRPKGTSGAYSVLQNGAAIKCVIWFPPIKSNLIHLSCQGSYDLVDNGGKNILRTTSGFILVK